MFQLAQRVFAKFIWEAKMDQRTFDWKKNLTQKFWLKFWLTQQWWSSRWLKPQNWSGFSCVGNDMVQMFLCQFFRITRVMHLKSWKKWRIFIKNHLPRLEKWRFLYKLFVILIKTLDFINFFFLHYNTIS